jgi:hypothetical protein
MRFWTTSLLLLSIGCVTGTEPESPGTMPTHSDSEGTDESEPTDDPLPMSFVPNADIPPDPDACDPMVPECDAGEKCSMIRDEYTSEFVGRCVPIADETVATGEPCVPFDEPGHDNCEAGSVCWDIMNGEGVCLGFCQGSADTPICGEDFMCNWGKSLPAGLCTPLCDPLSTAECPETCGCYFNNNNFFCLPRTSNIATGQPCGFVNDCAPLNFCVTAEVVPDCQGSACCAAWCDLGVGACGPETACVPFFEEGQELPGFEHVGICIIPGA